jgi:predicted peptidase
MKALALLTAVLGVLQVGAPGLAPGLHRSTFPVPGLGQMPYGISIPRGYNASDPVPLVLALHPGGERMPYYGAAFVQQIVAPALDTLRAIIVAPDCPTRSWADEAADQAVMALVDRVMRDYRIDRRRILVVGFSLGGRGTWFMASHHPDFFTAAIPMAASTGDDPPDRLATMPTYVIHSRDDQVVPFAPAERNVRALEKLGRPIKFEALQDIDHYQMGGYIESLRRAGRWVSEQWKKGGEVGIKN